MVVTGDGQGCKEREKSGKMTQMEGDGRREELK